MPYKDPDDPRKRQTMLRRRGKGPLTDMICGICNAKFQGRYPTKYCSTPCAKRAAQAQAPDHQLKSRRKAREINPQKFLLYRVKYRAKQVGLPFDLEEQDLVIPTHCPVLGIELIWNQGVGRIGYHPNSFSVDRIRPLLGYVKGNVRVISCRANLLKNDATTEELTLVLADLTNLLAEKKA